MNPVPQFWRNLVEWVVWNVGRTWVCRHASSLRCAPRFPPSYDKTNTIKPTMIRVHRGPLVPRTPARLLAPRNVHANRPHFLKGNEFVPPFWKISGGMSGLECGAHIGLSARVLFDMCAVVSLMMRSHQNTVGHSGEDRNKALRDERSLATS